MSKANPKVVVIGGGTGSFTLLSALKNYTPNLTAIVNMADDGGSTGILRDELGVLPAGDVRQCLVALSESPKVRDLFSYRFDEGSLKGHAFGNLFLTALEKMTGNFAEAVELASNVLNIVGKVEPVTLDPVTLVMEASDGSEVRGEFKIGHADFGNSKRPMFRLEPRPKLNPAVLPALETADLIVIAPGNLYGSLAPALIVPGLGKAIEAAQAKKAYVCNLVTKPGQTDGFMVHDFAAEIERLGGFKLDYVLYNTAKPSKELLEKYAHKGELNVEADAATLEKVHFKAVGGEFISGEVNRLRGEHDPLATTRTLIRHDADRIAQALLTLA